MAKKPPQQPEDIFDELLQDLINALGTDLVSVVLFGSAAAGRYVKGRSDMNLLIMVSRGRPGAPPAACCPLRANGPRPGWPRPW